MPKRRHDVIFIDFPTNENAGSALPKCRHQSNPWTLLPDCNQDGGGLADFSKQFQTKHLTSKITNLLVPPQHREKAWTLK